MPKAIVEEMNLYYTRYVEGILKLYSNPLTMVGYVKYVNMDLNKFPKIHVPQDIIVVDLPPLFGMSLSREFTAKLGRFMALYYTHFKINFENNRVKIHNSHTLSYLLGRPSSIIETLALLSLFINLYLPQRT